MSRFDQRLSNSDLETPSVGSVPRCARVDTMVATEIRTAIASDTNEFVRTEDSGLHYVEQVMTKHPDPAINPCLNGDDDGGDEEPGD